MKPGYIGILVKHENTQSRRDERMLMCFRPSLTSVGERNVKEEMNFFNGAPNSSPFLRGGKNLSPPVRFDGALLDLRCAKWVQALKPKDDYKTKNSCRL